MADFPVTYNSQEEFDAAISSRLNRERDKISRESGSSDELEQALYENAELQAELDTRNARDVLSGMGVTDQGRQDKIIRLTEWPEEADEKNLKDAFKAVYDEIPEAFPEDAQVKETGLDTSGSDDGAGPLTEAQVQSMSPEQINSNWDRVKAFISGER